MGNRPPSRNVAVAPASRFVGSLSESGNTGQLVPPSNTGPASRALLVKSVKLAFLERRRLDCREYAAQHRTTDTLVLGGGTK